MLVRQNRKKQISILLELGIVCIPFNGRSAIPIWDSTPKVYPILEYVNIVVYDVNLRIIIILELITCQYLLPTNIYGSQYHSGHMKTFTSPSTLQNGHESWPTVPIDCCVTAYVTRHSADVSTSDGGSPRMDYSPALDCCIFIFCDTAKNAWRTLLC